MFEKEKFSIRVESNLAEHLENYFIFLQAPEDEKSFSCLINFIEIFAEVEKIFIMREKFENNQFSQNFFNNSHQLPIYLIKFFNSKEKSKISFLLKSITKNGKRGGAHSFYENMIKKFSIISSKDEKTGENKNNCCNFNEIENINKFSSPPHENVNNSEKLNIELSLPNENDLSLSTETIHMNTGSELERKKLSSFLFHDEEKIKTGAKTSTHGQNQKAEIKKSLNFIFKTGPTETKIQTIEKENQNLENKKKNTYKIVYHQKFSGIKKRNTPDEERKKYVINIPNIVNGKDLRTTLMIKNIPNHVTQVDLLKVINKNYSKSYNFLYLPIDFNKKVNAGYAFINFKSSKLIINFFLELEGSQWQFPNSGNKICYLSYARIQGFRSIYEHFEKSSIMKQVDEKLKPIIISD